MSGPSQVPSQDALRERLFAGVYPEGIMYADKAREKGGDYARLAFLSFSTLELKIERDCPKALAELISSEASQLQAKAGQQFQTSTAGQSVVLGWKLASACAADARTTCRGT